MLAFRGAIRTDFGRDGLRASMQDRSGRRLPNCALPAPRVIAVALTAILLAGCASRHVRIPTFDVDAAPSLPPRGVLTGSRTVTLRDSGESGHRDRGAFGRTVHQRRTLFSRNIFELPPQVHFVSDTGRLPPPADLFGHTPPRLDWSSLGSGDLALPTDTEKLLAGEATANDDWKRGERLQDRSWFELGCELPDDAPRANLSDNIKERVWSDHRHFYSRDSLLKLGLGLAAAGVVANTSLDQRLTDDISFDASSDSADEFARVTKEFGNGFYAFPVMLAAALIGQTSDRWPEAEVIGDWGSRSLRTAGVGVPSLIILQRATGGARPDKRDGGSEWSFFRDPQGASGHTFVGAIPFITAAKMTDDPLLKASLYACSTLTGWSRVYQRGHYVSQAALGWWIAYLAASAVDETEDNVHRFEVVPLILGDGAGLGIEFRR